MMIGVFCIFTGHPTDDLLMAIECSFMEDFNVEIDDEGNCSPAVDFRFERQQYKDKDVVLWVLGETTPEMIPTIASELMGLDYIEQVRILHTVDEANELLGRGKVTYQ